MRSSGFFWILTAVMLLLDFYVFQIVKSVSQGASAKARMFIYTGYWSVSGIAVLIFALLPFIHFESWPRSIRNYVFAAIAGLFFAKLVASVFFLIDDLRRGIQWIVTKFFIKKSDSSVADATGISRSVFLNWLGLGIGGGLFASLIYGFSNKYNYEIRRVKLAFQNLPASFRGLKIVHISDIHSGSFTDKQAVAHGVEKILNEKADLILFTGDLVNDRAIEMTDYMDVFNRLKAPMGVFSTLGNHDYGDYYYGHDATGDKAIEKAQNLDRLKEIHGELGWKLLLDEHVLLEKGSEKIALIGVQNISGRKTFHSYGDLDKAYRGAESHPFKILMSHDPSHWDTGVRSKYPDIDLTLSGHTHGMQFGVEIPGFRWSPVQYVYKEWAGLYEETSQKLYVNRGYGFIGYPGRVGILPEITVIELA